MRIKQEGPTQEGKTLRCLGIPLNPGHPPEAGTQNEEHGGTGKKGNQKRIPPSTTMMALLQDGMQEQFDLQAQGTNITIGEEKGVDRGPLEDTICQRHRRSKNKYKYMKLL